MSVTLAGGRPFNREHLADQVHESATQTFTNFTFNKNIKPNRTFSYITRFCLCRALKSC